MDRNAFDRELNKYKIVRLSDHYTPRVKSSASGLKHSPRPLPTIENSKKKIHLEENTGDASFWTMMEQVAGGILTPEEVTKFLASMKKVYADVPDMVNLEDLNVAASLIKST